MLSLKLADVDVNSHQIKLALKRKIRRPFPPNLSKYPIAQRPFT